MLSPKIYNEQNSNTTLGRPGQVLMSVSWWECGSMSASSLSGLPLSLGFCIRDVLQKWTWWMWKSSINPEWLWQWIPFPITMNSVDDGYVLWVPTDGGLSVHTAKPSMKTKASLEIPKDVFTEVAQPGAGPATFRWLNRVFRLSTESSSVPPLQCRPAHSTLPVCLHPDLEGPAKGEKALAPCPSRACLAGRDWPCVLWMVPRLSGSRESSPVMEANPVNWQCIHSAFPTSTHEIPTPTETEHHEPLNDYRLE